MPLYLAELYQSSAESGDLAQAAARARAAASAMAKAGTRIRYVRSVFVPSDETWFLLYDADLASDVVEAAGRQGSTSSASLRRSRPSRPHGVPRDGYVSRASVVFPGSSGQTLWVSAFLGDPRPPSVDCGTGQGGLGMKRLQVRFSSRRSPSLRSPPADAAGATARRPRSKLAPAPKPKNPVDVIEVGAAPTAVTISDGAVWVVRNQGDTVVRIDPQSGKVVDEPIPAGKGALSAAAADGAVWVTNMFENTVTRIDSRSNRVVGKPIPVGDRPMAIAAGEGSGRPSTRATEPSRASMPRRERCSPPHPRSSAAPPRTPTMPESPSATAPCGSSARPRARSCGWTPVQPTDGQAHRGRSRANRRRRRRWRRLGLRQRRRCHDHPHRRAHRRARRGADRRRRPTCGGGNRSRRRLGRGSGGSGDADRPGVERHRRQADRR